MCRDRPYRACTASGDSRPRPQGPAPVHGVQHQAVRRQGTGQKPVQGVREYLPAVPEALLIPVQQAFIPVLHQPLQLRQALPVPGKLQPPEQQLQQLRGRLHLSLLDLGQILSLIHI